MAKRNDGKYEVTTRLHHNESLYKTDKDTGDMIEVKHRKNNIPDGSIIFEPDGEFKKMYVESWNFLATRLSKYEISIVQQLVFMAQMNTNSLEPLSEETTIQELSVKFEMGKNQVTRVFKKLYELGVYGRFNVYNVTKPYTKFWVLNPYLAFAGKLIKSDIASLFSGTLVAQAYLKAKKKQ